MRRSKAPSALNKAKRICNLVNNSNEPELETHGSEPEDEQYNWGSKDHNRGGEKVFANQHKRVFNIVWRDVSKKKHKTWKGDGSIEVDTNTMKAILKDETGKYMGCSSKFNVLDLQTDFQMVICGKEIELQSEIKDEEEIYELRKRQMKVRNWGAEEWVPPDEKAEEEKKPKGGFKFKPVLILKQPEIPKNSEKIIRTQENWETSTSRYLTSVSRETEDNSNFAIKSNIAGSTVNIKWKEFICFIKPSELQQFLFQQVLDYLDPSSNKYLNIETISSLDFKYVLRQICNHPSFVNHKSTTNELIQHLIPSLPEWTEMGPFDSGKLEYVQHFLHTSSNVTHENCIILAKQTNTLNMLQGLTDFMNIKCLRLNTEVSEKEKSKILNEFSTDNLMQVLLINSVETLKNVSPNSRCKNLIVFEDVTENIRILETWEKQDDFVVYYLVTAFSIEELLLLNDYKTNSYNSNNLLQELCNISTTDNNVCYLHAKIECKCFENNYDHTKKNKNIEFIKNWKHFNNPFDDDELQKVFFSGNYPENVVTIFYKSSY